MTKFNLLNQKQYKFNDLITVNIPLVGDVWGKDRDIAIERGYLQTASLFIQTPTDLMLELKEIGIYWTDVTEYEVFTMFLLSLLSEIQQGKDRDKIIQRWELVFPTLDCSDIWAKSNDDNKNVIFVNSKDQVIFNKAIYEQLSDLLCCILHAEKNREYRKVPEKETRDYILDRAKKKREREKTRLQNKQDSKSSSALDGVILFLVNNCNFKYNFETVKNITLYDLYASYKQINKNAEIDNIMSGYYFGTVDLKKIGDSKLQRIII